MTESRDSSESPSLPTAFTCLWFNGRINEAADFYTSLIPGSRILSSSAYPEGHEFPGDFTEPDALIIDLAIAGTRYQLLNGGPMFPQTEAASIVLLVDGQAEVDRVWDALVSGGGQESQCGWCKDRFGVSWQIVPRQYEALMSGPHAGAVARALQQMRKIDLATLEAAAQAG
ncbi:VOC family protein [Enemella dayhoffiae]|uniref:VOC family protein n=1 Tax=Enemella dayhoffiae TaxID=2016507 RepID=UPI0015955657|nr:VOC family protein [Enemella dayhoffiae]